MGQLLWMEGGAGAKKARIVPSPAGLGQGPLALRGRERPGGCCFCAQRGGGALRLAVAAVLSVKNRNCRVENAYKVSRS